MHLIFGLLLLLFAAVCASLDSFTKWKKSDNYQKSKRPCGAATEYMIAWELYKKYRDLTEKPDFRERVLSELNSWPDVRSKISNQYYRDPELLMDSVITAAARLRTAQQGKAPVCLTHGTSAAFPIPDGNDWAVQVGQNPMTYISRLGFEQSRYDEYLDMERRSQ